MAKSKKPPKKPQHKPAVNKKPAFELSTRTQHTLFIVVALIILAFLTKPMLIDGLSPQGVDVVASVGQKNQVWEHGKESGERVLWNPYIFGGMPLYQRQPAQAFSADNLLKWLGKLFHNVYIFYVAGFLGLYLLFRYFKMSPLISFLAAIAFVLYPHYKSLYLEGHFTKFRALMLLPWVFLSFSYFLNKRNILGAALFAVAFGTQIRTQHYQIVFYSGLMVFAIGIYPFLRDVLDKHYKTFFKSTGLLLAALFLSITMAAQPLFLAKEYLPYSKRGKTTINLSQPRQAQQQVDRSDGVTLDYATRWSTHPSELLTWAVPRFYGGMSRETYEDDRYQQLRGRAIPGYWGYMPFTQSYEYMGVVVLFLAVLGLYGHWRKRHIKAVAFFGLFLIILSFGRHLEGFYALFFNYFPFFNKFRAPMMSVTVTFFLITILAGYGLAFLFSIKRGQPLKTYKPLWITGGAFLGIGVLLYLFAPAFSFSKAGESYNPQVMEMIKTIRMDFFRDDVLRSLALMAAALGVVLLYVKERLASSVLGLLLIVFIVFDLVAIQKRVHKDYIDLDKLERSYFKPLPTDRFINKDTETFRILPGGQRMFEDNRWAYYHQTIGGYSPIKMYTIEELIQNNLQRSTDRGFPYNTNVLKFLNVKYVVLPQQIEHTDFELVFEDENNNLWTYLYKERLQRGFFVDDYQVVSDQYERLRTINQPQFDAARTAILEQQPHQDIHAPDSTFSRLQTFEPGYLKFEVYTDKQALFVISELYYPPGWKIFIDDKPVEHIYKTDHAVQSVIMRPGEHRVEMRFEPDSYYNNLKLSYASVSILYVTILVSLLVAYRERIRKWLHGLKK
ncbi:MAG: hypothetical protein GF313_03660 [Caldithrix sp.]|nr:hypothetical protein [Caldithrix sp.]